MSIDVEDLAPEQPKKDFRRANGAPIVRDPDNPAKNARYSRPSGWGHELDDESALVTWRITTAIKGVAQSKALAAKIVAADGDKEAMKELRDEATHLGRGNEASEIGTALHAMSVRYDDPDDDWEAPEPYHARLAQYRDVLTTGGLKSVHVEVHVVNDKYRTAGTADRIYVATRDLRAPDGTIIHAGELILGDLKTGKSLEYSAPGYTIQMALYADSVFYDIQNDTRGAPLGVHSKWGLLVHLPSEGNTCILWWADLDMGREGAELVRQVRAWRRQSDILWTFDFPDETADLLEKSVQIVEATHSPAVNGTWITQRLAVIGKHTQAREYLIRKWPEGLPPVKQGGHTQEQIDQVLALLDDVEAAYRLPFTPSPESFSGHTSNNPLRSKGTKQ